MGFIIEHDTNKKVAIEKRRESVILHYDKHHNEYFNHMEIDYEDLDDFMDLIKESTEDERSNWRRD